MKALKESEEKFDLLFNTIPDALYIIDQETGKILDVNKAAEKMYGYSREEWLQMKNTDVSAEPDKTQKATNNLPSHIPIRYHKKKDGTIFPIEMKISSYTLNDQRLIIATGRDITERIKSEEELMKYHDQLEDLVEERTMELKDSEAEINAIYNNIPVIIILVDEKGRIQKANQFALQFSGRKEGEILGLRGGEALRCLNSLNDPRGCGFGPECQFCLVRNTVLDTFKTGKAFYGIEFSLPSIKEQKRLEIYLLISTTPLTIKGKNMVLVSITDISDLKVAQNALKVSEEKYRSLVEDSQEGVWALDENENTTFVNPRICAMLGYTKNEMMGKNLDLLIPDSMKERIKGNRIRREKGIKETYDLELVKKDGTIIYTNIKAAPIMSESQKYKGSFAYITDITTQKQAEDTLRESEEKFRTISEQSLMGILISQDEKYKYANQAVANIFGYTIEELLDTPKEDFMRYIHPEDREFVREQATKKQMGMEDVITNYPYRGLTKSGETIWLQNYSLTITFEGKSADLITMVDFTERKKAEEKLKESEEKYRTISDYSMVGLSIIQDLQFKYVNQKFADNLGYTIEELLNMKPYEPFTRLIHPDDLELATNISKESPEGSYLKGVDRVELHCLKNDGNSIWLEFFGRSSQFEGRPAAMNVSIDITERRKAQQKLKTSEEKYRVLFNEAPFGIILFRPDGTILDSNTATERITGYKKADIMGKSFEDLVLYYNTTDTSIEERRTLVSQGKDLGAREIQLYKKNREIFWASSNVSLIQLGKETVVQAIIQDITKRKMAERKLKESEEKYRSLANELESILDHLPLIIVHKDDKNTLLRVNKYYADAHNLKKEDMEGKSAFDFYPHDLAQAYLDDDLEVIKSGKPKLNYIEPWESIEGSRWVNTSKIPYIDEEGNIKGIIAIVNDITEKKEIEEMKTYLLTRFSHEFKTPLISIKGFSDLLLSEYNNKLDEKMIGFLEKIKEGGDKLNLLVNTFMQSSQLGENLTRLNKDKENLSDLIKLGVSEMEGLIHLRKHTISVDIPEELIGEFDKEKIYTVITNLLLNAINYTPLEGKIFIHSKIEEENILFSIKDSGIGLTEEDKRRLFKPFGKIERYGKGWDVVSGGMGVGLSLSKEIIDLHGGKIWAESEGKNEGSTFYFSLPMTNN